MTRQGVRGLVAIGALAALFAMPTAAGAATKYTKQFMFDRCDGFSSSGENPFFSLDPGDELTLRGSQDGEQLEVKIEVTNQTENVDGTQTRVVQETEKADGELTEISRNFYAICNRDNSVVYFGEEVDIYEDGEVVAHDGEWRAGDDGAKPGIIMPGTNLLGARYFQELAPDVALDRAETVSLSAEAKTPAGRVRGLPDDDRDDPAGAGDLDQVLRARHRADSGRPGQAGRGTTSDPADAQT